MIDLYGLFKYLLSCNKIFSSSYLIISYVGSCDI